MNRESLKKSGLLEQYVLGLTNRKESSVVERAMEEDSEVMEDYRKLREELDQYVGENGMAAPDDGRQQRTARDFEELDHEMILVMTERTHKLLVWRYVLGAACLLLLCLSGYFFRLSEKNRQATVTEKAIHAQDNNNHDMVVKDLRAKNDKWAELRTIEVPSEDGVVLVHLIEAQELLLLDLSHLSPLPEDHGYYVFLGKGNGVGKPSLVVTADEVTSLKQIALHDQWEVLSVYRWPLSEAERPSTLSEEQLVASFSLTGAVSLAE